MIRTPHRDRGPRRRARPARARALPSLALSGVALLAAGCGWPNLHIVEQTAPPFVQTDNLDAPRPQGDPSVRTRKLFLGVVAALREQGRASAALAYLDDYDRTYPRDPHAMLLRADCLMDLDQAAAAVPIYRRLLDGPEEASAHTGLGQAAAATGAWAQAARDFGQAAALASSNVRYLNNQGYALLRAGDAAQAEFVLRKAAQLDPGNLQTRNNLILCLQREGKPVPQQIAAADGLLLPAGAAASIASPVMAAGPAMAVGEAPAGGQAGIPGGAGLGTRVGVAGASGHAEPAPAIVSRGE